MKCIGYCNCNYIEDNRISSISDNNTIGIENNQKIKYYLTFFIMIAFIIFICSLYMNSKNKINFLLENIISLPICYQNKKFIDVEIPRDNDYTQTLLDI